MIKRYTLIIITLIQITWFTGPIYAGLAYLYDNSICQGSCVQMHAFQLGYRPAPETKGYTQECHARIGNAVVADIAISGTSPTGPCDAGYSGTCWLMTCLIYARCGNGILEYGEKCDNGPNDKYCQCGTGIIGRCGDNAIQSQAQETCDDGNTTNGDGCSSQCKIESGCTCPGTSSNPVAGVCSCNSTPTISTSPGPSSANLNEGDELKSQGTYGVTDTDSSDTVSAAVKSVSTSGATASITLTDSEMLAMLTLSPTANVVPSGSTTGTLNWSFDSGTETFSSLLNNDTLTITYTVEVTDSQGAKDTETVTININGIDCVDDNACSGLKPLCESGVCDSCSVISADNGNTRCNTLVQGNMCITAGGNIGACGECNDNNDCNLESTGKYCQLSSNTCQSCSSAADCPADYECNGGRCEQSGGLCVLGDCLSDSDCSGNTPFCINNNCTACNDSSITNGDARCDGLDTSKTEVCIGNSTGGNIGSCGECDDHNDCKIDTTGKYCNLSNNTCNSCSQDSDCPSGYTCDESNGMCIAGTCASDADCTGATPFCENYNCVACNASGITNGDSRCDAKDTTKDEICIINSSGGNAGACGECDDHNDCKIDTTGKYCNLSNNTCNSCSQDSDCPSGYTCDETNGMCIAGTCASDADCADATPLCENYNCVACNASGITDGDGRCDAKDTTKDEICIANSSGGNAGACGECDDHNDCQIDTTGKFCNLSNNTCNSCSQDSDCPSGYTCDETNGMCIAGTCASDADCADATPLCENNSCVACNASGITDGDGRCDAKDTTKDEICIVNSSGGNAGACGECDDHNDCKIDTTGKYCNLSNNTCNSCSQDSDCPSGYTCDESNGMCIAGTCASDADCANATPLCENNNCVACNASGITNGDSRCDAKDTTKDEICIINSSGGNAGACGECDDHNDCQIDMTGKYCDLSSNTCNSCGQDSDCPTGYVCDENSGMCIAGTCIDDTDCRGTTPLCENNNCISCNDGSVTDGDARCEALDSSKTEFCISNSSGGNTGACGECDDHNDCQIDTTGKYCDLSNNTCNSCGQDSDCPAGYVCDENSGMCIAGSCVDDNDCSGGTPFCIIKNGKRDCAACNSSGISNSDQRCDDKNTSTDEVCIINSTGGNQGECGECDDNNDCEIDSTGKYCNLSSNTCNNCSVDSQCPNGYICDEALGQCKQGDCDKDSDCLDSKPICLNYTCGPCSSDGQCKNKNPNLPACVNGTCKECDADNLEACEDWEVCLNNNTCGACTENSQCPAGKVCKNGRCEDGCRTDAECGSGNVCLSGECVAGSWCLNSYQGFIDALPDLSQCQIAGKSGQEIRDKFESECAVNSKKAKCILCKKYIRTSAEKVCDATACMFGAPECKPEINKMFKLH